MGRFLSGFLLASALWGGALYAARIGALDLGLGDDAGAAADGADAGVEEETADEPPRRRRRGGRRGRRRAEARAATGAPTPTGTVTEGDDLGEDDPLNLDVGAAGGEERLSPAEISQAMDASFGAIRRCLVLAAGEEPVRGRLVFGLRIDPDGTVAGVRLTGPAAVASGEAGACLRRAAKGVRFPSYDGPPMTARYPVTLE